MTADWQRREHRFRFQLGDKVLFSLPLPLLVRDGFSADPPADPALPPAAELRADCQGLLIRSLPVAGVLPVIQRVDDYLRYVPSQYPRYTIDLGQTFRQYEQKFSSKTRATIKKKVRRLAEQCGGRVKWQTYRRPEEIEEFHRLARAVSSTTYQERLLDAGIPAGESFLGGLRALAAADAVRGFILFCGDDPIAYLYCPIEGGIVRYEYLGYDPAHREWSPGTVLQWLALEQLFSEGRHRLFDFTEGEGDHKRLFSTHQRWCADLFFLRPSPRTWALVRGHHAVQRASAGAGALLDRYGLKARLRRFLRAAQV